MTTNYHTALADSDAVSVVEINERLSALDAAIDTVTGGGGGAAASLAVASLSDEKATTTDGGGSSATTYNNRNLQTEVDAGGIVTISSNQFTPASGSYVCFAQAPGHEVDNHRLRLYNVTGTATVAEGLNCTSSSGQTDAPATLMTIFTANGTDAYRVDHYTSAAKATDGLGNAVGDGTVEVYLQVVLIQIG